MITFSPPTLIGIGLLLAGIYLALYFAYAELGGKLDRLLEETEYLQKKVAELDCKVDEVPTYRSAHDSRQRQAGQRSGV